MKIISLAVLAILALTNITVYSMIEETADYKTSAAIALVLGAAGVVFGYMTYKVYNYEINKSNKFTAEAQKIRKMALEELRLEHNITKHKDPLKILNNSVLKNNEKLQKAKYLKGQAYIGDIPLTTVPGTMCVCCLLGACFAVLAAFDTRE